MKRPIQTILMIGCGSIGQAILPILVQRLAIPPEHLYIITADQDGLAAAQWAGCAHHYIVHPITSTNLDTVLAPYHHVDLVLNLSVDVSSLALISWCQSHHILYLDTCVEPWPGHYESGMSNATLRQMALNLHQPHGSTALIAHGMNPGVITYLAQEALLILAAQKGIPFTTWGTLAKQCGVTTLLLSEFDSQVSTDPHSADFINTWSPKGLYNEAYLQDTEIGWGTHELTPKQGEITSQGILQLPGGGYTTTTWSPSVGLHKGLLVTHHEVISLTHMLTSPRYRPTIGYAYHICAAAWDSLERAQTHPPETFQILKHTTGADEIGVIVAGRDFAFWHGVTLHSNEVAFPFNNATSQQVVGGILAGILWMQDHPQSGVVEAEDLPYDVILQYCSPFIGKKQTLPITNWTPPTLFT